jgi:hypothetical protein
MATGGTQNEWIWVMVLLAERHQLEGWWQRSRFGEFS